MSEQDFREIARNGLWRNNPGLVQLLGLCPLLGTSNSTVNALGLGLATMLVLACSNAAVSLVRGAVSEAIRLPAFVMIIAVLTTCIELLMQAWTYELYQVLGIFIPLITTNCVILGRAEAFAAKNGVLRASFDGLLMGLGFALVLLVLGGLRGCSARVPCWPTCTCCSARRRRTGRSSRSRSTRASCWRSCRRARSSCSAC